MNLDTVRSGMMTIIFISTAVFIYILEEFTSYKGSIKLYLDQLVNLNIYLESASFKLIMPKVGFSILDFCGSILVCRRYRMEIRKPKSLLEALAACLMLQFGGTTITGLLLGQTPSWILSHTAIPAFLLAFYLIFQSPVDIVFHLINNSYALYIIGIFASISCGHAVTSWGIDKALDNAAHLNYNRISQSFFTCLFCGIFSSCGGGILGNWFAVLKEPSFALLTAPSLFDIHTVGATSSITQSFWLALLYYILVTTHHMPWNEPLLSIPAGKTVIGTLLVAQFTVTTIDPTVNVFAYLTFLVEKVLMLKSVIQPQKTLEKDDAILSMIDDDWDSNAQKDGKKKNSNKKNK